MEYYADASGISDVWRYDIGLEFIVVQFKDGSRYKYTYDSAGKENIEQMKALALRGDGLNAFINQHVRKLYDSRL